MANDDDERLDDAVRHARSDPRQTDIFQMIESAERDVAGVRNGDRGEPGTQRAESPFQRTPAPATSRPSRARIKDIVARRLSERGSNGNNTRRAQP